MKNFFAIGVAVAAFFWGMRLPAVVMVPMEIESMAERAQLIVQGTVVGKICERDGTGRIFTRVELRVAEVWKGTFAGTRLQVVHGGGSLGQARSMVSGQVEYEPGEEVVGFFVINDRGEAVTLGLAQGKFHVWVDRATGQKLAANPFVGHGSATAPAALRDRNADAGLLTLSRLKQRVQGTTR